MRRLLGRMRQVGDWRKAEKRRGGRRRDIKVKKKSVKSRNYRNLSGRDSVDGNFSKSTFNGRATCPPKGNGGQGLHGRSAQRNFWSKSNYLDPPSKTKSTNPSKFPEGYIVSVSNPCRSSPKHYIPKRSEIQRKER